MLNIHESIKNKLQFFYDNNKIPNILFHGPSGSGKKTLVCDFIKKIYNGDKEMIKSYVMYVNCSQHGKGIKFIRDELKFFAKTRIYSNGGNIFKSIILSNADKLTIDAQSALRRCIELFSHTTRFFIVAQDKYALMKPILSRFCEIYVSEPFVNGEMINLYKYNIDNDYLSNKNVRMDWLKKELTKIDNEKKPVLLMDLIKLSTKLYEKSYSGLDVINLLENTNFLERKINMDKRYELIICFNKVKKELRNEKLLFMFMFQFIFLDNSTSLENISFI